MYKKRKKILTDISVCVFTVAQRLFTFTDPGDDKQTLSRLRSVCSLIFSTFREKSNSLNKHNTYQCTIVLIKTSVFVLYSSNVITFNHNKQLKNVGKIIRCFSET